MLPIPAPTIMFLAIIAIITTATKIPKDVSVLTTWFLWNLT